VYNTGANIGAYSSSSNNSVLVTGEGSLWANSGTLSMGSAGGNQLTISNGGTVYDSDGGIGGTVLVTGNGSVWTNNGALTVGNDSLAKNCRLTIANGGKVYNKGDYGTIGSGGSSSNTVLVTGSDSVWNNNADKYLRVGYSGSGNQLIITNGGKVYMTGTYGTYIGYNAGDNNNAGLVTGPGSAWSNSVLLAVGRAGASNQLTITQGGTVYNLDGYIGQTGAAANSNRVFVSGSGSVWRTTGTLTVNGAGTGNGMILSTGGVAAVSGTVSINAGGYVTNYVAKYSGGLDMSGSTLTLNGKMGIVFAGAPTQLGPYWGLRWAGDHTNALKGYANSGALTISDGPDLPAFWQNKAAIYYDSTNTYVGFPVSSNPATRSGTLIMIR
jgi:T5SS/PEP-CTERM-associated repeat protein